MGEVGGVGNFAHVVADLDTVKNIEGEPPGLEISLVRDPNNVLLELIESSPPQ